LKSGHEGLIAQVARQAIDAAAQIVDQAQRAEVLAALIANPAIRAVDDERLYHSAMELLLLTPAASRYLTLLPPQLLARLVYEDWL
jgi:hypothetical protein